MGYIGSRGGIMGSTWIGVGEGKALGISLRAAAGAYLENVIPSEDESVRSVGRLKLDFEGNIQLSRGHTGFYAGILFSTTYRFPSPDTDALPDPTENSWDYWSIFLKLGYTTRLPRLLAP